MTTSQDDATDSLTIYTGNFTASLDAITSETVTAGTVSAQIQVVLLRCLVGKHSLFGQ